RPSGPATCLTSRNRPRPLRIGLIALRLPGQPVPAGARGPPWRIRARPFRIGAVGLRQRCGDPPGPADEPWPAIPPSPGPVQRSPGRAAASRGPPGLADSAARIPSGIDDPIMTQATITRPEWSTIIDPVLQKELEQHVLVTTWDKLLGIV